MRKNLSLTNQIIAGMVVILILIFTTGNSLFAQVRHTDNDAGKTVKHPALSIDPHSVLINQLFGDGSIPKPAGILSTSSGSQIGRLYRDGYSSTCDSTSTFYTNGSENIRYETYTFRAAATGCTNITATFSGGTDYGLYCAIYSTSYYPTNYTINGIAQGGISGDVSFSCPVVKDQTYVFVVMEVWAGSGTGDTYSIAFDNVASVPVSIWWIVAAFILIGSFAFYKFRNKKVIAQ
jgi:hypothetical protein